MNVLKKTFLSLAVFSISLLPAIASAGSTKVFTDTKAGFSLRYPTSWDLSKSRIVNGNTLPTRWYAPTQDRASNPTAELTVANLSQSAAGVPTLTSAQKKLLANKQWTAFVTSFKKKHKESIENSAVKIHFTETYRFPLRNYVATKFSYTEGTAQPIEGSIYLITKNWRQVYMIKRSSNDVTKPFRESYITGAKALVQSFRIL